MSFPDFEQWRDTVLKPDDTSPWDFRTPEWYEYYKNKYRIAMALRVDSVLEVGVRYGYSAFSFCQAMDDNDFQGYFGIDADKQCCAIAKEMLLRHEFGEIQIDHSDSKTFQFQHNNYAFDLIHIDADHSREGCLADLNKFSPHCSRAILVDDYDQCDGVRQAVDEFCLKSGWLTFYMPSIRGEALLLK